MIISPRRAQHAPVYETLSRGFHMVLTQELMEGAQGMDYCPISQTENEGPEWGGVREDAQRGRGVGRQVSTKK